MNILVIGNGFDLAHGLPTKYTDFLEFCKRVFPIYENVEGRGVHLYQQEYLFDWDFNKEIKEKLKSAYEDRRKVTVEGNRSQIQTDYPRLDEMYLVIKDNIWIEYFFQCSMYQKENWIDFETEISKVIHSLDNDMSQSNYDLDEIILELSNEFLNQCYSKYNLNEQSISSYLGEEIESITYREIRDRLYNDLNRLIRALEIYLTEYVEKITCNKISPDITDIVTYPFKYADNSVTNKLSKVLSFNYTSIFEQIYSNNIKKFVNNVDDTDKDYIENIHGKADINNSIETNNIVLGIDEYLPEDRKHKDVEFIAFKKFYQRIHKGTGCQYKEWIDNIKNSYKMYSEAETTCLEIVKYALKMEDNKQLAHWIQAAHSNNNEKNKSIIFIFSDIP